MQPRANDWRVVCLYGLVLAIAGVAALGLQSGCGSASSSPNGSGGRSGTGAGGSGAPADAGSGVGGATAGGTGGAVSTGTGGRSGPGGSTGAGGAGCLVTIDPVSPPSFAGIEAGGARVRVRGTVGGARTSPVVWQWAVSFEDGSLAMTKAIDDANSVVEFVVDKIGRYEIVATIAGDARCRGSQIVTSVAPRPAAFVLRANIVGYPVQNTRIELAATDPQPTAGIRLDPGVQTMLSPTQVGTGAALPSYLRVSLPSSGFSIEGDTLREPFAAQLLSEVTYDLLIVPSNNDAIAPDLISGPPRNWGALALDAGIPVSATLRDGGGRAVTGARLVLRRGELPSTIGVSDQNGALALRARRGTLAAYIVPPVSSGLPRVSVGANGDAGIALDGAATSLTLGLAWKQVVTAALSVEVRAPDGTTLVGGATVHLTTHGAALPAGTLTVQAGTATPIMLPALGTTDVEVATGATGVATLPSVPTGTYDLTVVPPVSPPASPPASPAPASPGAITTMPLTLPAGTSRQMVTLAPKAQLAGTLTPLPDSAGARVTAIDKSSPDGGTVVTTIVAADGSYTLTVDPGRSYQLLAEPAPGATHGRAVLAPIMSAPGTIQVGVWVLPRGHLVKGVVMSGQGLSAPVVGNVLIQAFCPVSAKCPDPTFPLADAISRADGTFQLLLPEPAN